MAEDMSSQLERSSNMFSQLEGMMTAVRHETAALEKLKSQVKDMDQLKKQIPVLQKQLVDSQNNTKEADKLKKIAEEQCDQLKSDLQRLNDMYKNEHTQNLESQKRQLRLDEELTNCKLELEKKENDYPKISELQKVIQEQKIQMDILKQKLEEEQRSVQKGLQMLEKQNEEAERCKESLSQHFWAVSEELKQSQNKLKNSEESCGQLEQALRAMGKRVEESNEEIDRIKMEQKALQNQFEEKTSSEIRNLESLNRRLADGKSQLADQVSSYQSQLEEKGKTIEKLEESIKTLRSVNDDLSCKHDEECTAHEKSRNLIGELNNNIEALQGSEGKLHSELKHWEEKYAELENTVKIESDAKSDALKSAHNNSTVIEALEKQLKEANRKNWESLQKYKETELEFESRVETMKQEINDKDSRIKDLEEEREKIQKVYQDEMGHISNVSGVLKSELEKRLDELGACSKERDTIKSENSKLMEKLGEMEENLKKKEKLFAHVVENDRTKLQGEMKSKNNRLRALENEKQDLLKETQYLTEQLLSEQKAKAEEIKEHKKAKRLCEEAQEDARAANAEAYKYRKEVERLKDAESQLRSQMDEADKKFREDISRLDELVKSSKRTAAQQVTDLSNRVKALNDELSDERKYRESLVESQETATNDSEKWSSQLESLKAEYEEFQFSTAKEIASLKRELQHSSGKVKSLLDIRAKMDMELVQLRLERARSGSDVAHLSDRAKELEGKVETHVATIRKLEEDNEKLQANNRRLKASEVDAEAEASRCTKKLKKTQDEVERLEKHYAVESKRMRQDLNAMNRKLQEKDDMISALKEESENHASSHSKLQNTSNKTITGLIEELKRTEDILASERKTNNQEISTLQHHLTEMKTKLENTTHTMQEKLFHHQSEKTDKENLLNQLNSEASRLKTLCNTREQRIADLEKQHQEDRSKIQDLRNQLVSAENKVSDIQLELAKSETKRKTLSEKVEQMENSALDWNTEERDTYSVQNSYDFKYSYEDEGCENVTDECSNDYYGDVSPGYHASKYTLKVDDNDEAEEVAEEEGIKNWRENGSADERVLRPASHKELLNSNTTHTPKRTHHSAPARNLQHSPIVDKYDEFATEQYSDEKESNATSYENKSSYGYKKTKTNGSADASFDDRRVSNSIEKTQMYLNGKQNHAQVPEEGADDVSASIARTQKYLMRRAAKDSDGSKRVWGSLAQQEKSTPPKESGKMNKHRNNEDERNECMTNEPSAGGGRRVAGANFLHDDTRGQSVEDLTFDMNAPSLVPASPPHKDEKESSADKKKSKKAAIERMKKKKSVTKFDDVDERNNDDAFLSGRSSAKSSGRRSHDYDIPDEEDYDQQQQEVSKSGIVFPRISPRQRPSSRGKRQV